jgi:hypothetical protein
MIQHNPDAAQMMPGLQRPEPPASLLRAVKVMYAGALFCAIHTVIYLVTEHAEQAALAARHPHLAASHLATLAHVVTVIDAVIALIGALLFLWIARSCKRGKNGARVTGTTFFVIAVLGLAYDLTSPETTLNLAFIVAECLIGLAAVVLLWQRGSNTYFAFFKRPQF